MPRKTPEFRQLIPALGLLSLAALSAAGSTATVRADVLDQDSSFHVRAGYLSEKFSTGQSSLDNSYGLGTTLDFEYERFTHANRSFLLRSIIGYDVSATRLRYEYVGVGQRFYLFSNAVAYEGSSGADRIILAPKIRYYLGGDAGISFASITEVGPYLDANAALLDLNANAGATYQLNKSLALELQLGLGLGYGFSAISATATSVRALGGIVFFF
jgi:hypothetical protein